MKKKHVGETFVSRLGEKYTIIAYEGTKKVTVQFEDGTIVKNRTYSGCKHLHVGNPNNPSKYCTPREGKTKKMLNGLKATIIKAIKNEGKSLQVLIRFEDGYERVCGYTSFMKGQVKHPKINTQKLTNRLGMTVFQKYENQNATVIEYEKDKNFVIQFEDGTKIHSTIWKNFVLGKIQLNKRDSQKIIGTEGTSLCGLKFKVVNYKNQKNMEIKFEDGTQTIIEKRSLKRNRVLHPIFDLTSSAKRPISYKGLKMYFVFKTNNNVYFKTNELGIMEVHELLNYTC